MVLCKIIEGIRLIDFVLPEFECRLTEIMVEHRTPILVTRQAKNRVITLGLIAIGIEDTWPIKYMLPRRICHLRDTNRKHKTIVHGMMVLCKMIMEAIRLIEFPDKFW